MKKQLSACITAVVVLLLLCTGALTEIVNFSLWLFTLQYSAPETSIAGGIIVRILSFLVSFSLVGFLFDLLGWYNGKLMKIAYAVISALLGFVLSYIVWKIEQHIVVIGIVLGIVLVITIAAFIVYGFIKRKKNHETN